MGYFDAEDDNQQSMPSSFQYGGDTFADVNNLDHCIKYLNQTLTTFGFPSTLNLHSNDPTSIVQTCNCIYALLQQRQRDVDFRGVADDQRQRVMSDMTRLEAKVERQDSQLAAKERELASLTSKVQKGAVAFKTQLEKLQHERDEFQRLVVSTQQVRVQQSHELKKKEKEYVKLQEKLNQVLTEKKKETKPGLEIMNLLQKEGRQRGTWNSKKADGDFYKMIVDAYEAKKQELMAENTDLRALLRSMQSDMRDFLNAPNALAKANSVTGSFEVEQPSTPRAGSTDVFDLPFHMARDQIEQSLRAKMASIKERMVQVQEAQKVAKLSTQASDRELELEAQLVEARSIISEQASLMDKHLTDPRSYAVTHMAVEMARSEADEDSVANEERANHQLEDQSAMQKMAAALHREPVEVDGAKGRPEKQRWPKSQNVKLENAKIRCETQIMHAENEGPFEAQAPWSKSQVATPDLQKCGPELLQVLQDKEDKLMLSQESCAGPIHDPMYKGTAPKEWCRCAYSSPGMFEARLGIRIHSETQPVEWDSFADAKKRWYDRRSIAPDHTQLVMQSEHAERQRACPKVQNRGSQSQRSSFDQDWEQPDTREACPDEAMAWPKVSSSGCNSQSSREGYQSGRPVFQFIVHDDWLEESQLDILVPSSEIMLSQKVQLMPWMENKQEDGPSTHLHALQRLPSELQTEQEVSCPCFHMPSVFVRKKK